MSDAAPTPRTVPPPVTWEALYSTWSRDADRLGVPIQVARGAAVEMIVTCIRNTRETRGAAGARWDEIFGLGRPLLRSHYSPAGRRLRTTASSPPSAAASPVYHEAGRPTPPPAGAPRVTFPGVQVNAADPSRRALPEKWHELYTRWSGTADRLGVPVAVALGAAVNMLINTVRDSRARALEAERLWEDLRTRGKGLLMAHYDPATGRRRNIFPHAQHIFPAHFDDRDTTPRGGVKRT